jgi:hypothetical protein
MEPMFQVFDSILEIHHKKIEVRVLDCGQLVERAVLFKVARHCHWRSKYI